MDDSIFSSLNPYQTLDVVIADDPQTLVAALMAIKTPIKIIAIVPVGARQAAYIVGHIQKKKTIKAKG